MYPPIEICPRETSTSNSAAEWSPRCMIGEEIGTPVPAKPGTLLVDKKGCSSRK